MKQGQKEGVDWEKSYSNVILKKTPGVLKNSVKRQEAQRLPARREYEVASMGVSVRRRGGCVGGTSQAHWGCCQRRMRTRGPQRLGGTGERGGESHAVEGEVKRNVSRGNGALKYG